MWRDYLVGDVPESEAACIRLNTHTGRPLGAAGFVHDLEKSTGRRLMPAKGGGPAAQRMDADQHEFAFE